MKLNDIVKNILLVSSDPMTPQDIREQIKMNYPDLYGTPAHLRNVEKGHYKDVDHALLAQIYTLTGKSGAYLCDKTKKPMKISLVNAQDATQRISWTSKTVRFRTVPDVTKSKYEDKIANILTNADKYHDAYYRSEIFRGPSLYFHQRALATRQSPESLSHLEYVYATLASWGMHRMGKGGSKMQTFEVFFQSVQGLKDGIWEARNFDFRQLSEMHWAILKEIFFGLKVMASGTTLVGNSKAMHHMLPNVIPPIDREYTLRFLRGNKNIRNDLETEWLLTQNIISTFFIPVASDSSFFSKAATWMTRREDYPWDTSLFKVIDNIVIGSMK